MHVQSFSTLPSRFTPRPAARGPYRVEATVQPAVGAGPEQRPPRTGARIEDRLHGFDDRTKIDLRSRMINAVVMPDKQSRATLVYIEWDQRETRDCLLHERGNHGSVSRFCYFRGNTGAAAL